MPNIIFHTCSMKINISEQTLPFLNIAANEHHLAKLQLHCFFHLSLSLSASHFWIFVHFLSNFSQTIPRSPNPTLTHMYMQAKKTKKHSKNKYFSLSSALKKRMEEKALTWFTGKCLGCVVTEDDSHSMLFCLLWHPGNVLDIMELSDLSKKERVAAAHCLK